MKTWNSPAIEDLDFSATAANHQNGNHHGRICRYNSSLHCNAQGNGNGICNNCIYNPAYDNDNNNNGTNVLS
uniref:hypothetical protein n=1 Tax=Acetatifactor sp. TaxID=1872090 RepID=UPI004055A585